MTQQSAAHDALTESETQLQMIADSVPAYIGSIDSQQRYRFVNRAYVDRWGKSPDEIVGMTIRELLGEELYGKVRGSVERALSGERLTFEYEATNADGSHAYIRSTLVPELGTDGSVYGIFSLSEDIADQRVAERAIRESRAMLSAFMESSTDSHMILDRDLRCVDLNSRAASRIGLPKAEIIGRVLGDFSPLAKSSGRLEKYREVLETGRQFGQEVDLSVHGVEKRLVVSAFRIQPGLLRLTSRDITDRVTAERALKESEARYRGLFETAPSGIMTANRDGMILEANPAAHRMFGYAPGEMPGLDVSQLRADTPDGEARGRAAFTRFTRGENVENSEQQMLRKDGSAFWISASIDPIFDENGTVIESRSVVIDITERRRMEEVLAARDRHMRAILDNIADAVITMDVSGTIESVNPAAAAMFGFSAAELYGVPVTRLMAEPDSSAHGDYVRSYLRTGKGKIVGVGPRAVTGRRKDGRLFPMELSVGDLQVEGRQVFVGAMRDTTERTKMEQALRAAKEVAEHADGAKTRFLANASHELRTPLNAILGFSGLMAREIHGAIGNPKYLEYAADIAASGEHLLSLINDLLDVAKIESGHADLVETDVDVEGTVGRCLALVADQAERGQVTLSKVIAPNVGLLHCDRRTLTQILLNLLSKP